MHQLITIIIIGFMLSTSVTGIFAFVDNDNVSTDSDILINNDSRLEHILEADSEASLASNYIEDSDREFIKTKIWRKYFLNN